MNAKALFLLAVLTAAAVYGAIQIVGAEDQGTSAGDANSSLLPALDDRLNDVAKLVIEGTDETLTLERGDGTWTVAEQSGYPADFDKLSELMAELKQARRIERKTKTEAGFAKLGVLDPDATDSTSRRVTMFDASGAELASLIVGNRRFGQGSAQGPVRADQETYVRVGGEEHAWLAAGDLNFTAAAMQWLDAEIASVGRERVQAARFDAQGAPTLTLVKPGPDAYEMEPLEVPEDREKKTPLGTSTVLNGLSGLRFEDVQRADDFGWAAVGEPGQVDVTFWTNDGLRITASTVERDDKTWARFHADVVVASEAPSMPGAEEEVAGPPATTEQGVETGASDEAEEGPDPEALAEEAAALNAKFDGWVFGLPSWKASAFRMTLEDVLAPLPEPEEETVEEEMIEDETVVEDPNVAEDPPLEDPIVVEDPPLEDPIVVEDPPVTEPPANDPPAGGEPGAGGGGL